jgi:hypothetical protein
MRDPSSNKSIKNKDLSQKYMESGQQITSNKCFNNTNNYIPIIKYNELQHIYKDGRLAEIIALIPQRLLKKLDSSDLHIKIKPHLRKGEGKEFKECVDEKMKYIHNKFLDLSNINFLGESAKTLAWFIKADKTIKSLNLSCCNIDDQVAIAIAEALKVNTTLQTLNLSSNNISNQGAEAIAAALGDSNTGLKKIDLSSNKIVEQGLIALTKFSYATEKRKEINIIKNDQKVVNEATQKIPEEYDPKDIPMNRIYSSH